MLDANSVFCMLQNLLEIGVQKGFSVWMTGLVATVVHSMHCLFKMADVLSRCMHKEECGCDAP